MSRHRTKAERKREKNRREQLADSIAVGHTSSPRGRKREEGPRTPSGQLSRSSDAIVERSGLRDTLDQPHRRLVPKEHRRDQRAESELGRLMLHKNLTEVQCQAGEKYRRLMRDFSSVLATPMTTQSALASMVAPGLEEPAEAEHLSAVDNEETPEDRRERILGTYDGAMRAIDMQIQAHNRTVTEAMLQGRCGMALIKSQDVFNALDAVVIRDEPIRPEYLQFVEFGLTALAWRWRLEDSGERQLRAEVAERPRWDHEERNIEIVYAQPAKQACEAPRKHAS